jgi:hypothetical protein
MRVDSRHPHIYTCYLLWSKARAQRQKSVGGGAGQETNCTRYDCSRREGCMTEIAKASFDEVEGVKITF